MRMRFSMQIGEQWKFIAWQYLIGLAFNTGSEFLIYEPARGMARDCLPCWLGRLKPKFGKKSLLVTL